VSEPIVVTRRRCARKFPRGVALLALLLALAIGGIAMMVAVDVWSLARQRAREQELLFVGDQYRVAIERYYFGAPPGTRRMLPSRLEDLLEDDRYPTPVRHLRRIYPDPITSRAEWGVLRIGERIGGVFSLSNKAPVKQAEFARDYQQFSGKTAYREWVFAVSVSGQPLEANPISASPPASGAAPSISLPPVLRNPS
jgi:type II secretory pathway pseudopilin PulG